MTVLNPSETAPFKSIILLCYEKPPHTIIIFSVHDLWVKLVEINSAL